MTEMKERNIYPELPTIREQPPPQMLLMVVPMIADILTG